MSLINNKKRVGPRTEPCGTPEVTGTEQECAPFTTTNWERFFKNAEIQA